MRQYDVFQSKYTAEQIEKGLDNASPQIGENGNWYVWDILSEEWVDTGVVGRGSHYEITEEDYEEIATITERKLQPKIVETIHLKSDGNTIWLFDDEEETPLTYLQVKAFIENEKNIVYLTNGNYSFYNKYKYFPQGQSNAIGFVGETQLDGEVYSYRIVINSNDEVKSDEIQLAKNQDLTNKADKTEVNELKEDIARQTVEIDNRIKKFYTSNLVEEYVADSDDGAIRDIKVYGKSEQGENPSPDNPQAIHSVVNPKVKVTGKNLLNINDIEQPSATSKVFNVSLPQGTYTFSCLSDKSKRIRIEFSAGEYIDVLNWSTNKTVTFTTNKPFFGVRLNEGVAFDLNDYDCQLEFGSTATPYEPYTEQTATLNGITLNAIPVSSGGNVTINGQQYIADYVDEAKGVIVRKVYKHTFTKCQQVDNTYYLKDTDDAGRKLPLCVVFENNGSLCTCLREASSAYVRLNPNSNTITVYQYANNNFFRTSLIDGIDTVAKMNEWLSQHDVTVTYPLATPTEEPLTEEQLAELHKLRSYYGGTNVVVSSDDISGASEFLYPCSIENFVEYVKEQQGDTRKFIYDMSAIADEAFINAQYAEIMAEWALE